MRDGVDELDDRRASFARASLRTARGLDMVTAASTRSNNALRYRGASMRGAGGSRQRSEWFRELFGEEVHLPPWVFTARPLLAV